MWHLQLWHHMHAGRLSRWPNASFWQILLATCTRKHCIGRCRGCCAASSQLPGCRDSAMHVHRSKRNADLWTHSRRPDRPDPDSDLGPTTADPPPTPKSWGPTRSVRPAKRQASAAASQFETFGSPGVDQAGGLITTASCCISTCLGFTACFALLSYTIALCQCHCQHASPSGPPFQSPAFSFKKTKMTETALPRVDVEFTTLDGLTLRGWVFPAAKRGPGMIMSPGVRTLATSRVLATTRHSLTDV